MTGMGGKGSATAGERAWETSGAVAAGAGEGAACASAGATGATAAPDRAQAKILVADDDEGLRQALRMIVQAAGYACVVAENGAQAVELAARERPDVAVLDVMMPGLDGFEAVERIRAADPDVPILMLSAKADIVDKKVGFRLGADDYMAKPFNEDELVLRIQALLRRSHARAGGPAPAAGAAPSPAGAGTRLAVGDLAVDLLHRRVTVGGQAVALTPREFDILATLAADPGRTFASAELIALIWGPDFVGDSISIPVYIRRLRKKLEANPSEPEYIQTVHQVGYRVIAR